MITIGPHALELELAKTIVNQLEELSKLGVDDKANISLTLGQLRILAKAIVSLKEENMSIYTKDQYLAGRKDAKEYALLDASDDFRAEYQTSPFTEDFVTINLVCSWLEKRASRV